MSRTAYFLVYHGSSDPRPAAAVSELAALVATRLQHAPLAQTWQTPAALTDLDWLAPAPTAVQEPEAPAPLLQVAALECAPQPLHQQVLAWVQTLASDVTEVVVVPLFLLPGVHVMTDIPAELALVRQVVGADLQLTLRPHLGTHPRLRRLLTERMSPYPMAAWILLSHGSRRPGANATVESLAHHLGAIAAFWATPPHLDTQLHALIQGNCRKIGVLPYCLFPGGIVDAIAAQITTVSQQFSDVEMQLADPLNASPELADLVVDLAVQR